MDDEFNLPGVTERERHIRRRVHRLAEFYQHLFIYVIVIGALWVVNLWQVWGGTLPGKWWAYWAIWATFGWGIGLFAHGLSLLPVWSFFSQDWEDKKVREMLARDAEQAGRTSR